MIVNLPIGDWSKDGHGMCDYVSVECNKSLEELREIHFNIESVTGIDIHNIVNEYMESLLDKDNKYVEMLKNLGFDLDVHCDYDKDEEGYFFDSDVMADMWIHLLKKVDSTLTLEKTSIPMLPFYGFDEKHRHIGQVGYGIFY